jgi:hypothetical protein
MTPRKAGKYTASSAEKTGTLPSDEKIRCNPGHATACRPRLLSCHPAGGLFKTHELHRHRPLDGRLGQGFQAHRPHGKVARLADFRGKAVVMFFGYTQCPDVCPTTLSTMREAMALLGDDAQSRTSAVRHARPGTRHARPCSRNTCRPFTRAFSACTPMRRPSPRGEGLQGVLRRSSRARRRAATASTTPPAATPSIRRASCACCCATARPRPRSPPTSSLLLAGK